MKRRNVVKGLILFSLGGTMLYSCKDPFEVVKNLNLTSLTFDNKQLGIIDRISRIILPIKKIPKLTNHTTLPFVMKSVNDLYSEKDRKTFQEAYTTINTHIKGLSGTNIAEMEDSALLTILQVLNAEEAPSKEEANLPTFRFKRFYDIIKSENLQYLRTSEYFQREKRFYEMTPGRFDGNFPISELKIRPV